MPRSRNAAIAAWICQVVAALVLAQTLFFKFSGAEESRHIFETIGAEPFGRYASGVVELIAAALLLTPRLAWLGAAIGLGVISGAIVTHLTRLGIEVMGDGGLLFGLACVVFATCAATLILRRRQIPILGPRLAGAIQP